jgi:hypothetical protein
MLIQHPSLRVFGSGLILCGILTLAGCGGGGGSATLAPTSFTVSGTAATGAPFAGATVSLIASDGTTYPAASDPPVVTGTDGSYSITLPLTAKPPFVVQAATTDQSLVSVVAEAKDSTANITPVTNLIAALLSPSGNPANLANEVKDGTASVTATTVAAKDADVVAVIKPLMDAVGTTTDPLNGTFTADGTGADQVLDSLLITITPASATSADISVAVKQQVADNANPASVSFTNTTASPPALTGVTAASLAPTDTGSLVADFLQRWTACFALPQSQRVNSGGTTAADIIAPACLDLFVGQDPAGYLNNGSIVHAGGAFSGIFGSGTNIVFTGSYQFTRDNGDPVISWAAADSSGNILQYGALELKTDTDGKLRAIGNQYHYSGGVNPYHQLRTFLNETDASYYSTGYNLSVNNTVDAKGNPLFAKVVVTSPAGNTYTLQPTVGYGYLVLMNGATPSASDFVRVESAYAAAANSGKNPANSTDSGNYFAANPLTDAQIADLADQSVWQFDYYLAGNTTTTPDATQYYRTLKRALTIAELETQPLAAITAADIASITANTKTNANGGLYLPTPASGPYTMDWQVPTGALAPTNITVWGGHVVAGAVIGFNDGAAVASTARTGSISCKPASAADTHCDSSGNYVPGGFSGEHLWATDAVGREFASFYAFYTITVN